MPNTFFFSHTFFTIMPKINNSLKTLISLKKLYKTPKKYIKNLKDKNNLSLPQL